MEHACLRHTELPHTSRLFSDFQYHFDRVNRWYAHPPQDFSAIQKAAEQIQFSSAQRAALVQALRSRNPDSAALQLLAREGTVAVVTGQQVGLFSGPAYTIYKALTAVRLARHLTENGIPAVPVFWLATEDHDLAEVNHGFVFTAGNQPVSLKTEAKGETQQPVGSVSLVNPPVDTLRTALAPFPFGSEIADDVAAAYHSGTTFGCAFEALLRKLLADYDLLFVDPLEPAIRALAAPILSSALAQAPALMDELLVRNRELEQAGYHAQVHVEAQTSLVFLLEGNRRITLRRQDDGYHARDRVLSVAELQVNAAHLSPNALLRPVVQDSFLPTVAYVGGPAELAYFAQSEVLYRRLLGRMPVVMARSGFTLLDARSAKLWDRYHLTLQDFFAGEGALRETIASHLVPPALKTTFAGTSETMRRSLENLRREVLGFDPTLADAIQKSAGKVEFQIGKLEKKTAREALRRDERASADAAALYGLLYPRQHLQERYYSILPFLARHGKDLIGQLYDLVHLDCPDHQILAI